MKKPSSLHGARLFRENLSDGNQAAADVLRAPTVEDTRLTAAIVDVSEAWWLWKAKKLTAYLLSVWRTVNRITAHAESRMAVPAVQHWCIRMDMPQWLWSHRHRSLLPRLSHMGGLPIPDAAGPAL